MSSAIETINTHNVGTWLISLRTATERREKMVSQLNSMQLPFRLFDAIDGNEKQAELITRVDPDAYARNMGSGLIPGKMGVYASHIEVWQEFLGTDHSVALILEDDVVFHEDFTEALHTALSVKHRWDVIRFNCIRAKIPVTQSMEGNYRLNAYLGPFTGNAAYLIKRDTVEKLLPRMWPQTRALDHELNRFFYHNYRQLGLEPWSSHPDDGGNSTITGSNYSLVKKPHWTQRLPHYRLKFLNYLRRAGWLIKNGMLKPYKTR